MALSDEVKARVSLRAIVEQTVTWDLRKSNTQHGDYWAPCPFHGEKTASFHVTEPKGQGGQFFCFGCNAKGSVIDFLMARDGLSFTAALRDLADQEGIERTADPARIAQFKAKSEERQRQAEIQSRDLAERGISQALRIWRASFANHPGLAAYLEQGRGIRITALGGLPPTLRYHPDLPCYEGNGGDRPRITHRGPAMVGFIGRERLVGVHLTWIDPTNPARGRARFGDGSKVPKKLKGRTGAIWGQPVVLSKPYCPFVVVGDRPIGATEIEVIESKMAWLEDTDRSKLPSKCGGVRFNPASRCPNWRAFMELILPDPSIRNCTQRILGACLFGENRAQICVLLRGPGGNGKSTLLNTIAHVLGRRDGYAATCKVEMFLDTGQQSPSGANPEEVDLPGARAYIATEPGARDVLSAKKIKGLTGGDRRMSRGNYENPFFWTPTGIPLISCNRTPKIKDEDEGTRRRLVFVPFDVNLRSLPPDKQRSQGEVEAELRREASGILNWLIEGFQDFLRRGIALPEPMTRLKIQLLETADPVGVFLAEMTHKEAKGRLSVSEFYKVHEAWCEQEGRQLFQMKTVGDIMVEKGFERGPVRGRSHWKGLKWAPDAADLVERVTGNRPKGAPPAEKEPAF